MIHSKLPGLKDGSLDVIVSRQSKLHHYRRLNSPGKSWILVSDFGDNIDGRATVIQSNYGGNYEVVAHRGKFLTHYYFDAIAGTWYHEIQPTAAKGAYVVISEFPIHAVIPPGTGLDPLTYSLKYFPTTPSDPQASLRKFLNQVVVNSNHPLIRVFHVTDGKWNPNLGKYNCHAWCLNFDTAKPHDLGVWPDSGLVSHADYYFKQHKWEQISNGDRERGYRKVALYGRWQPDWPGQPPGAVKDWYADHSARERWDGDWYESKLGGLERIVHDKFQMAGGGWGKILRVYRIPDPAANLDLK